VACLIASANPRRPIVESLQPAPNLKTMAASSAFQLPSQFHHSTPEIRFAKRTRRRARICKIEAATVLSAFQASLPIKGHWKFSLK